MRVLVYGLSSQLGGVESFFNNYYIAMRENGLDIIIDAIGVPNCALKETINNYGGDVYEIYGDYRAYVTRFMQSNAKKYNILWANLVDLSDVVVLKEAKKYGISNIIVHGHSSSIMVPGVYGQYRKLRHLYNRFNIRKYANHFWACSDLSAKWMFPSGIIENNENVFVPNAICVEKYTLDRSKRNELRIQKGCENQMVIGFIGRMSFEKNPLLAVKIFAEIKKKNVNSRLLMIGDGVMRKRLEEYVLDKQIEDVEFLGICKDIPEKLQILDAVIIPSYFEGMPMVAIESQASGLHVFASKNSISKHTKIVDDFDFIDLNDEPKVWAEIIMNSNLERKETYDQMVSAGFELNSAAINLYNRLMEM